MSSDNDFLGAMAAESDQARMVTKDIAERVGLFRKTLICEGFDPETASNMAERMFEAIVSAMEVAAGVHPRFDEAGE